MTDTLPPRPETPSELDALREVVDLANEAVAHTFRTDARSGMSAERAFYQSWQAMVRHMLAETLEGENRALAWDRVEALEAKLEEISAMVTAETVVTAPDFLPARIREVLDR